MRWHLATCLATAALGVAGAFAVAPEAAGWIAANVPQLALTVVAALALYAVPGCALLALLWRDAASAPLSAIERFALGSALGITLPPLLLLLTWVAGATWSHTATFLYVAAGLLTLLIAHRSRLVTRYTVTGITWRPAVGLAGLLLAVLALRLYMARDIPVGLFGDSLHHTLITQLLVDNGGLFRSWAPYAPLTTFTYHFGFHANTAFFHWLTGEAPARATVLAGQIHSSLALCGAFALGTRLTRLGGGRPALATLAGLLAALATGFVNPQPAYYVNWGRYTQLAGQVALPAIVLCWLQIMQLNLQPASKQTFIRLSLLCGVATAGLLLTHYIVSAFAAVFVLIFWGANFIRAIQARRWLRMTGYMALAALIGLALAAPWIANTSSGYLTRNTAGMVSGAVDARRVAEYSALGPLTPEFVNPWVLAGAFVGMLLAVRKRHWLMAALAGCAAGMFVLITPATFGLPGAGVINVFTGYIGLYVPLAPLAGFGAAASIDELRLRAAAYARRRRAAFALAAARAISLAAALAVTGVIIYGLAWQQRVVDLKRFQLVTPADIAAMAWVRANTPADARFLVNAFPAYGGTLLAGNDAGWWLPYLAGRASTLPPITYGSERGVTDRPEVQALTVDVWARLRGRPFTDATPVTIALNTSAAHGVLKQAGITHVYIGANSTPPRAASDHLDVDALRNDNAFALVYDAGGVLIFKVQ
jgi:hypothetical protein